MNSTTVTVQGVDFVATFPSEQEKVSGDAALADYLRREGLEDTIRMQREVDWSQEVGERVPLELVRIPDHPTYVAVMQFEDESYMKYYSDHMSMTHGSRAKWSNKQNGWMIRPDDFVEAWDTIEDLNEVQIPMADTLEWDTHYDWKHGRILFYPYVPGRVGEPKQGDHWAGIGVWDDVTRSFVFTEEDWEYYMTFYGYES